MSATIAFCFKSGMEALKKKEFEKVLEELLGAGRLSYVELYKCRNFLKIAKRADEMIASNQERQPEMEVEENVDQTTFSFDWLMRFSMPLEILATRICNSCGGKFWPMRLRSQRLAHSVH